MTPRLERFLIFACCSVSLASTAFVVLIVIWIFTFVAPMGLGLRPAGNDEYGFVSEHSSTAEIGVYDVANPGAGDLPHPPLPDGHTLECIERDSAGRTVGGFSSSSSSGGMTKP